MIPANLILIAKTAVRLDGNLIIQYTLCSIAFLGALVWIVVKAVRAGKRKNGGGSCCGCSLSSACSSAKKGLETNEKLPKRDCHQ